MAWSKRLSKATYTYLCFVAFLFVLALPFNAYTQDDSPTNESSYLDEPIEDHHFNEKKWERSVKSLDYSEDPPKEKKDREHTQIDPIDLNLFDNFSLGSGIAKMLLYIVIIALIVFVLYKLVGRYMFVSNTNVNNVGEFSWENLDEEDIHESDLERYLREALEHENYRVAIRVYYLMIVKELSLKELIRWKKDKTNYEYLREMHGKEQYRDFKIVTLAFEGVWYGDIEFELKDYQRLKPIFEDLLKKLKPLQA